MAGPRAPAATNVPSDPRQNRILGALPNADFERLAPSLEPVRFPRDSVLEEPFEEIEYVYFPIEGVASIVALGADGESSTRR